MSKLRRLPPGPESLPSPTLGTYQKRVCNLGRPPPFCSKEHEQDARASLESDENRLRLEQYAPNLLHALLNIFLESQNIRCSCIPAIHNRQRVLAGNADGSVSVPFAETRVLNQPRG